MTVCFSRSFLFFPPFGGVFRTNNSACSLMLMDKYCVRSTQYTRTVFSDHTVCFPYVFSSYLSFLHYLNTRTLFRSSISRISLPARFVNINRRFWKVVQRSRFDRTAQRDTQKENNYFVHE